MNKKSIKNIFLIITIFSLAFMLTFFNPEGEILAEEISITHIATLSSVEDPYHLGGAWGIFTDGNYAYVGARQVDALTMFDISDPYNPVHTDAIRGIEPPICISGASGLEVAGDYAFVTGPDGDFQDRYNALSSFDISNPNNLVHIDSIIGGDAPYYLYGAVDIEIQGNYAYVVSYHSDALTIFDISDPYDLKHVSALKGRDAPNYLYGPYGIFVEGNYAYIACVSQHSLTIVDISDPANPATVGVIKGGWPDWYLISGAWDVVVEGNYAYIACAAEDSLTIVDVSDPTNPTFEGYIKGEGAPNYLAHANGVDVEGDYAVVAAMEDNALTIINISDPANPTHAGTIRGAGAPNYLKAPIDVSVEGDFIYVTSRDDHALSIFKADLSEKPDIEVSKNQKYFDNVNVGSQDSETITVSNTLESDGSLVMGNITISGDNADQFSITSDNVSGQTLQPGDSATFKIRYSPTFEGGKTAIVSITSNDPDENPLEIFVCGGNQVGDFITDFYQYCLERAPDADGLEYWAIELFSGNKTAEDLGYGFIMSDEYIAKNTSNEEFVTMLYNVFIGKVDSAGREFWVDQLNTSATRPGVINGFVHSQQFKDICENYGITAYTPGLPGFVTRFYTLTLERMPDIQGRDYWVDLLETGTKTGEDIAYGFIFSNEFLAKDHPNGTYVSILYNTFFDRVPDEDGYIFWVSVLESGYSREYVLDGFIHSSEFETICANYGISPY
jgi:hypothetical protein